MLARFADDLPVGDGWLDELDWRGFRFVVHRRCGRADVVSRHGRNRPRRSPRWWARRLGRDATEGGVDGVYG